MSFSVLLDCVPEDDITLKARWRTLNSVSGKSERLTESATSVIMGKSIEQSSLSRKTSNNVID